MWIVVTLLQPAFNLVRPEFWIELSRVNLLPYDVAEAEWMGGFRSDVAAFLDDTTIDACIEFSRPLEVPPREGVSYSAFTDPSGGRHDHFTCCIGHREGSENHFFVCDVIRGRGPPFDPHEVVSEYAQLCRDYGISTITGDNFAQDWVSSAFEKAGIRYVRAEQNKSQLYLESLPQFAREALSIPDHPKLIRELRLLERHTSRLGRDAVDHPRNGSDDYANALCGALRQLAVPAYDPFCGEGKSDDDDPDGRRAWRVASFLQHVARYG